MFRDHAWHNLGNFTGCLSGIKLACYVQGKDLAGCTSSLAPHLLLSSLYSPEIYKLSHVSPCSALVLEGKFWLEKKLCHADNASGKDSTHCSHAPTIRPISHSAPHMPPPVLLLLSVLALLLIISKSAKVPALDLSFQYRSFESAESHCLCSKIL